MLNIEIIFLVFIHCYRDMIIKILICINWSAIQKIIKFRWIYCLFLMQIAVDHPVQEFTMNIHGRQSDIGVQRSCHRVTNCNERARIDVEESRGNQDDDEDEAKWDEIEKKPRRKETRAKGRGKKMKKPLGSVTRFELSNGNHKSVIASGLSKAKYNYRLLRERKKRVRARERNCSFFLLYRARYERVSRSFSFPDTTSSFGVIIVSSATRYDSRAETCCHIHFCIS